MDKIFKVSVDSLVKEECYPKYIRDQFKTLVMDSMQSNNNLYKDAVVISEKRTRNSDPENFFSAFYNTIVLENKKYIGVENPQSMLITSKIAEKLLHYFNLSQQIEEGSPLSPSKDEQHISLSEKEL